MQALLSLDDAPPISAPFRFFLTAPLFGILAGALLLYSGADLYASRWTPAALALTHLMTAGFMLQVMLGAMLQLLPVVAGANMAHPLRVATWVHGAITPGGLIFLVAAVRALWGVPVTSPVIRGLQLVLVGLGMTLLMGLLLAAGLGGMMALPLVQLTNVHMGWGFVAWGGALLGAVGFVVVPMFQQTPDYPAWFRRGFSVAALALVVLWSGTELLQWPRTAQWLSFAVVLTAALLAGVTYHLQRRSRRTGLDATQRLWQLGMLSAVPGLAASAQSQWWANQDPEYEKSASRTGHRAPIEGAFFGLRPARAGRLLARWLCVPGRRCACIASIWRKSKRSRTPALRDHARCPCRSIRLPRNTAEISTLPDRLDRANVECGKLGDCSAIAVPRILAVNGSKAHCGSSNLRFASSRTDVGYGARGPQTESRLESNRIAV